MTDKINANIFIIRATIILFIVASTLFVFLDNLLDLFHIDKTDEYLQLNNLLQLGLIGFLGIEMFKHVRYKDFINDKILKPLYIFEQYLLFIIGTYIVLYLKLHAIGMNFLLLAMFSFGLSEKEEVEEVKSDALSS